MGNSGHSVKDTEAEIVSAYFRRIGTGWRVFSTERRSMVGKMTSARRWALRRLLYGPSGQGKRVKHGSRTRRDAAIAENGGELPEGWK